MTYPYLFEEFLKELRKNNVSLDNMKADKVLKIAAKVITEQFYSNEPLEIPGVGTFHTAKVTTDQYNNESFEVPNVGTFRTLHE